MKIASLKGLGLTFPLVVLLALQFMNGMITSPSLTFFPVFLSGLGRSAVFISFIVLLQRITGLASSIIGGVLSDWYSKKRMIILGMILFFGGAAVFLTGSSWPVAVFWAASGLGMGLYSLASQSAFIDLSNPKALGVLTALYYWAFTIGATLGNPAAGFLLGKTGYGGMAAGLIIAGAGTVLAATFLLPRSARSRNKTAGLGMRDFFGYAEIATRPPVILLGVLRLLPTFCYGMLLVFIPLLLSTAGASNAEIALFASISNICAALAQLVIGRASDRISPRWPALFSFFTLVAGSGCTGLFPTERLIVFVSGTLAVSAAWCLSTLVPPMVERMTTETDRGRVLGCLQLFWNIGMILSALAGGFLFEARHGFPFLIGAAVNIPSLVLTIVYFRLIRSRDTLSRGGNR
jgi:MFS family permease